MIPVVGDAIGKGGKAAKFIANKADDVMAFGKSIKCKVTGTGCFVAGTKVWVSATVDSHAEVYVKAELTGRTTLLESAIAKQAIENVAVGSRVSGENPRPWEYGGKFSEPDQSTWALARFSLQKDDGSWIDVEMIRPAEYWEKQGVIQGELAFVEFPKLKASRIGK